MTINKDLNDFDLTKDITLYRTQLTENDPCSQPQLVGN